MTIAIPADSVTPRDFQPLSDPAAKQAPQVWDSKKGKYVAFKQSHAQSPSSNPYVLPPETRAKMTDEQIAAVEKVYAELAAEEKSKANLAQQNANAPAREPQTYSYIVPRFADDGFTQARQDVNAKAWAMMASGSETYKPVKETDLGDPDKPLHERTGGKHLLSLASGGDVVILQSLSHLGTSPSGLQTAIRKFQGKGVRLYIVDLMGPVEPALPGLLAATRIFRPMERELAELKRRFAEREQEWKESDDEIIREMASELVKRFGVPMTPEMIVAGAGKMPELGALIKLLREQLGWTQKQLADRADTSKPTVSRIEAQGKGEAIPRILTALHDALAKRAVHA